MDDRYIAAIDLGTSKIALTVAQVHNDDIQVIYYHETPAQGISYSYVFNPQKAAEPLRESVARAENELKIKIRQAVVNLPRYEVSQRTAKANLERSDKESAITLEEINYLKSIATDSYPLDNPEKEIMYGVVAQSFSTDEYIHMLESDLEGMVCDSIDGDFKVYIGMKRHSSNVDRVMNLAGIAVAAKYFLPEVTAKAVLTNEEMDNGVALIEIGAGSTSVTIYQNKILRHYSSIPFGGKTITNDIKVEGGISERIAENIKLAYGACMPDKLLNLRDKTLQINNNESGACKQLPVKYLSEIITSRLQEITDACLYKIEESGFADSLRSGIVITGGTANIPNLSCFIKDKSGYNVRIGYPLHKFSFSGCNEVNQTSATASIGMILAAKENSFINCLTEPPIFDRTEAAQSPFETDSSVKEEPVQIIDDSIQEEQAINTVMVETGICEEKKSLEDTIKEEQEIVLDEDKDKEIKKTPKIKWFTKISEKVNKMIDKGYDGME